MPCDYSKYPKDWKQIRARILERAGHKCERCGLPNYCFILRNDNGSHYPPEGWTIEQLKEDGEGYVPDEFAGVEKHTKIILTIAHTHDPDPMNCADDNLEALCQRCHNKLDAPMRARNAAVTRARKERERQAAQGQLMLLEQMPEVGGA